MDKSIKNKQKLGFLTLIILVFMASSVVADLMVNVPNFEIGTSHVFLGSRH